MTDRMIRGHFPALNIRFALCQAASLCSEAVRRHQADWISGWLLSEALASACLLSVNLKHKEKFTLRWMYPGPVGTILADTNEHAEVRGFPQRLRLMDQVSTLEAAMGGDGRMSAITSVPDRVMQTGITAGGFKEVPRDMANLLGVSFQIRTAMRVGLIIPPREPVTVHSALGVLIQALPQADPDALDAMVRETESGRFRAWLESEPHALEAVLARLAPAGADTELLAESVPRFNCQCSRTKVETVLRLFDPAELRDILEEEGHADVNCHFCATCYTFSRTEIEAMLGQSQSGHA